ncbi:type II secretion system protein N [Croceicoccus naphthovorans]|uniref:Uncharacterized protein n=1 Tax=Croceicoccus naphthovorans TaxID=1348774 RepID=A0A0G3XKQ8_9SPHN|nr:type II secretion system protein N [Croceicoccus naphthovorans]AKM11822.1 hypothetical protein AB433_12925 [Croceicoccus naphthovorans]MBB3988900.1 general secretion pathway protein C [Croceicoccus naphthovorans]
MRFVRASASGRRLTVPGLHDVVWWLLAAGIVVAGAQLFWMIVTPVSPLGDWKPTRVRLMNDSARSALMTGFDPFNREVVIVSVDQPNAVAVVTDLPLTLFGIRMNPASGGGTAIVAGSDGEQGVYRIGEEVMDGVTLSAVAFDHVTLSRGGGAELLYLDQSKPAPTVAPTTVNPVAPPPPVVPPPPAAPPPPSSEVSASALQQGIAFAAGDGGIMLNAKGDGAAFRRAGLRSGDVLTAVNGRAVSGAGDLSRVAGQLSPGSSVTMTVKRNGRDVPVRITVSQ